MKFGVEFVPYLSLDTMGRLAREAEHLGFGQIWVCDHYHNRYVHSVLAQLATKTSKIRLGPGVTNPYLSHPAVTAAAVATLNDLSGGRALLGISSGDPIFLETVGIKQQKPLTSVRESLYIINKLFQGERVEFKGESFFCRGAKLRFKVGNKVPIYLGGRRQKMLHLAGELADGALINASHLTDIKDSIVNIKKGLDKSGRSSKDFDFVAYMVVSIDEDGRKARSAARGVVAFVASSAPEESLKHRNIPIEDVEVIRGFLRKGEIAKARKAVTGKMLDEFSVCGRVDELVSRIRELKKIGATRVVIGSPIGPNPSKSLKIVAKELV